MKMKATSLLAVALGLSGCAHQGGGSGTTASASYTNLSAVRATGTPSQPGLSVVRSRNCSLGRGERAAVLAALARLEPEADPDRDDDFHEEPSVESGLLITFRDRHGIAMTVMLRALPLRQGQASAYIRVNGRLARVAREDLTRMQAAATRSGCRISVQRGPSA
jgi:hypothetical protein